MLGLLCLLPFTRHLAARKMRQRAEAQAMRQRAFQDDPSQAQPRDSGHRPNVIEGEYERRDK
ncbi:phage T7 F exclusion suppressor FxsA [compost metagenome]